MRGAAGVFPVQILMNCNLYRFSTSFASCHNLLGSLFASILSLNYPSFAGEEMDGPGLDIEMVRNIYQGILELYNPEV
jgi:hypothetical protein